MNFKSLSRDGVAYEFVKYDSFRDNGFMKNPAEHLDDRFMEYQTFGDGMIQHSTAWAVSVENFVDALASLADHLFQHPEDLETVESFPWPDSHDRNEIRFYSGLKHDENKRRYYNASDLKVSGSASKSNDRRWEEVPSWADGSISSIFRFIISEKRSYYGAIARYSLYSDIRDFYRSELGTYMSEAGCMIGIEEDQLNLEYAFLAVHRQVEAYRTAETGRRVYGCLKNNWLDRIESKKVIA